MGYIPGIGMVTDWTEQEWELEQSNKQTAIASNEAALEAAELANEAARIDNAAKKKALAAQSANAAAASQMTNEFLSKWGDMNQTALDLLQNAISGDNTGLGSASMTAINETLSNIKGQVETFDQEYGGTIGAAYDATMSDIQNRGQLTTELMGLSEMDQAGAAGRAATDVGAQYGIARGEMAREAMSAGVDPTSGKFGALQKKSFLGEARSTVEAMNKARVAEKERATTAKGELLRSIDPSVSAGVASDLMSQKTSMLGLQTDAAKALAGVETARAGAITDVAKTVSDIGSQYGSLGSTMLGLSMSGGTTSTDTGSKQMFSNRG